MVKPPKIRSAEFKLKIVLETFKNEKTIVQLASEHQLHPKQIQRWRNQLLEEAENIFLHKMSQKKIDPDKTKLINTIDQLTRELDFLKKKLKMKA